MGEIDIENLFKIYQEIQRLKKLHNLPFRFKIDEGTYETAIEFIGVNYFHPPIAKDWSTKPIILCPDLLDYENKIIIEYEEEIGERRTGAKLAKKGHHRPGDYANKHDFMRNTLYKRGGFSLLQIYQSDKNWKTKLEKFLLDNLDSRIIED